MRFLKELNKIPLTTEEMRLCISFQREMLKECVNEQEAKEMRICYSYAEKLNMIEEKRSQEIKQSLLNLVLSFETKMLEIKDAFARDISFIRKSIR